MRRLCLAGKDELLEPLCEGGLDASKAVEQWLDAMRRRLESSIRKTGVRDGREAMTMPLLGDSTGILQALSASLSVLCKSRSLDQESRTEGIFWNTLSQLFKRKMDELDGYGAGHGTHVLQVRRRLDKMAKDLVERKARMPKGRNSYKRLAELATDLAIEVRQRGLEKQLPATPTKLLDYLYESEAASAVTEDPWDDRIILGEIVSSDTLIQLEQCMEMLAAELRDALSIKFGSAEQPVFLDEESYKLHYGVGREAMRKRTARAQKLLLECLLGGQDDLL